jgi:hypothetical protein
MDCRVVKFTLGPAEGRTRVPGNDESALLPQVLSVQSALQSSRDIAARPVAFMNGAAPANILARPWPDALHCFLFAY